MANYGSVTTKKHMTPEKIWHVLNRLNRDVFFGCLEITNAVYEHALMDQAWHVQVREYESECIDCWLNTYRQLQIRNSSCSDFIRWTSQYIQDEFSRVFNGRITNDGCEKPFSEWGMPDTFPKYVAKRIKIYRSLAAEKGELTESQINAVCVSRMRSMLDGYPKQYRDRLKGAMVHG